MDKRYQVFISSTFVDLVDERQAVQRAVLELDHMPAGMELFPATDDSAWELIKDVIDASDFYVLIIGGRYGSLDETGLGFTEREYDYALQTKKPVVPLLHADPEQLPRGKTETDAGAWQRLGEFRSRVESAHTCVYWSSSEELKAKVITGLIATAKRHPVVGWVRADQVPSAATMTDVLTLRNRIAELEAEIAATQSSPPAGTQDLAQGDDRHEWVVRFRGYPKNSHRGMNNQVVISAKWNTVFGSMAPTMIHEASEEEVFEAFRSVCEALAWSKLNTLSEF